MRWPRRRAAAPTLLDRPLTLRGLIWPGDGSAAAPGEIHVGRDGVVQRLVRPSQSTPPSDDADVIAGAWIGPGIVVAHVHLAFGGPEQLVRGGVVAARDLGAPPAAAARWRAEAVIPVEVAGPLLTAPGGYPSRSWGAAGFAAFVDDVAQAQRLVSGLASQVDVVKLALEPAGGPVPAPDVAAAVVEAAHAAGRPVVAHALTAAMVERALDAGVDELAHTPVETLPNELVYRLRGSRVASTLHTFQAGGQGGPALANAERLLAAGAELVYGTDLGNTATRPGADPRELALLAGLGLGHEGALRRATRPVVVGAPAGLVVLDRDPLEAPDAWLSPRLVVAGRWSWRP